MCAYMCVRGWGVTGKLKEGRLSERDGLSIRMRLFICFREMGTIKETFFFLPSGSFFVHAMIHKG